MISLISIERGDTSLILSSFLGHIPLTTLLLEKGANVELKNHVNVRLFRPLLFLDQEKFNALILAVCNGHKEIVTLLLKFGASIKIKSVGE